MLKNRIQNFGSTTQTENYLYTYYNKYIIIKQIVKLIISK